MQISPFCFILWIVTLNAKIACFEITSIFSLWSSMKTCVYFIKIWEMNYLFFPLFLGHTHKEKQWEVPKAVCLLFITGSQWHCFLLIYVQFFGNRFSLVTADRNNRNNGSHLDNSTDTVTYFQATEILWIPMGCHFIQNCNIVQQISCRNNTIQCYMQWNLKHDLK